MIHSNSSEAGASYWRLAFPMVALVAALWLWMSGPPAPRTPQQTERDAIALCWKDQSRKSLPPDQARFIASTCEMMAGKYRQAYGVDP